MAALLNRARMTTATTGTGTITLGSAVDGYATFAEASAVDATVYSYCIEDGDDFEIGVGTYTSSGTTFSRDTVTLSKISGTSGTSKIDLSGTAEIFITARSGDLAVLDQANSFTATQTFTTTAAGSSGMIVESVNDTATIGPGVTFRRTSASPAAEDDIGFFNFQGQDSGGNFQNFTQFRGVIESPTDGSESGRLEIYTPQAGPSLIERLRIAGGLYHPSATGGDKGNNTINFGAVYDDNTLLSCYPFDAYIDKHLDVEKWDAKAPDIHVPEVRDDSGKIITPGSTRERQHDGARKFAARLGGQYDPLDLEKYIAHWKEKRHLTALPNEVTFDPVRGLSAGAWIQRLVETVEVQAIHIAQLHDRLKALETPAGSGVKGR